MEKSPIPTRAEIVNLFWRATWTAVQAFTAAVTASGLGWVDVNTIDAGKIAALGAVLALVKTYASDKLGTGTAADPPQGAENAAGG